MASKLVGTRRMVVLVSAMAVLGLAAPAAVHADPPPPPPNPDIRMAQAVGTAPAADRGLGVPLIGVNAWLAITNQGR